MPIAKPESVRLSSKGQLVIPRKIRELLHWDTGTELTVTPSGKGVTIQPARQNTGKRLERLRGCLSYRGPRISDEQLQAAVDYQHDWKTAETRED